MKIKSVLTLSAVAAALMISGVHSVRAADVAVSEKTESVVPAHKIASATKEKTVHVKHKAHKAVKKVEKKAEVSTDATVTTEPTSASGQ